MEYNESNAIGSEEWSAKLGLNTDIGASGNLRVQGFYASGQTQYGANPLSTPGAAEWSVLASYEHTMNEKLNLFGGGQYMMDIYNAANVQTNGNAWYVHGGFAWTPVTNFRVRGDIFYSEIDAAAAAVAANEENWGAVIELRRSF